jgi:hypothetical protein
VLDVSGSAAKDGESEMINASEMMQVLLDHVGS